MKNTRKILSLLMAAVLLCLPCLLASCETEAPADTSSTETVAPPTHAELFWEALITVGDYFKPMESAFGMPLLSLLTTAEEGVDTEVMTIDKLTAMGVNMLGDQPVRKEAVTVSSDGISNTSGTWFAAGEEIVFKEYADETLQYAILPGVEDSPFVAKGGLLTDLLGGMKLGGISGNVLGDSEEAIKALFTDEMILIAESDEVNTYTVTMDSEAAKAFQAILDSAMEDSGLTDLFGAGNTAEEPSEATGEITMVLVLNTAAGKNYRLKLSTLENGNAVSVTDFRISVNGAVTELQYTVTQGEETTAGTSCTFTAAANRLKIDLENLSDGTTTTADLTLTADETKKLTFTGNVDTSYPVQGMTMAIPIAISGTYQATEDGVKTTLSLSASMAGLMEIAISTENVFKAQKGQIVKPTPGVTVREIPMDVLMSTMESTYPGSVSLYNTLSALTEFNPGALPNE